MPSPAARVCITYIVLSLFDLKNAANKTRHEAPRPISKRHQPRTPLTTQKKGGKRPEPAHVNEVNVVNEEEEDDANVKCNSVRSFLSMPG